MLFYELLWKIIYFISFVAYLPKNTIKGLTAFSHEGLHQAYILEYMLNFKTI